MNQYAVPKFTPYATSPANFAGYLVDNSVLALLEVPCHLISTEDDPAIDIDDLQAIYRPESLTVEIHHHGGHCGFIKNYRLEGWIDQYIVDLVNEVNR